MKTASDFIDKMNLSKNEWFHNYIRSDLKTVINEARKEAIEECAEKAELINIFLPNCDDHTPYWGACISCGKYDNPDIYIGSKINKESILSLINELK